MLVATKNLFRPVLTLLLSGTSRTVVFDRTCVLSYAGGARQFARTERLRFFVATYISDSRLSARAPQNDVRALYSFVSTLSSVAKGLRVIAR